MEQTKFDHIVQIKKRIDELEYELSMLENTNNEHVNWFKVVREITMGGGFCVYNFSNDVCTINENDLRMMIACRNIELNTLKKLQGLV